MGLFTSKREKQEKQERSDVYSIQIFDRLNNKPDYINSVNGHKAQSERKALGHIIRACQRESKFERKKTHRLASAKKIESVARAMAKEADREIAFAKLPKEAHKEIQDHSIDSRHHEEFFKKYGFIRKIGVKNRPRRQKDRDEQISIEHVIREMCGQYAENKSTFSVGSTPLDPSVDTRELVTQVIFKCQEKGLKNMNAYYKNFAQERC